MTQMDPEATATGGSRPGRPAPARARVPAMAAAFSALLAAACMPGIAVVPPAPPAPPAPAAAVVPPPVTGTWREPDSVKSVNGVLDVVMAVVQDSVHVPLDSDSVMPLQLYQLLRVNGDSVSQAPSYPAPTFIVAPGDLVRIKLVNRLGKSSDSTCMTNSAVTHPPDSMPDCFHGPTYSNIHYHGFHVTPDTAGDDVLLDIAPHSSHQYEFRIPPNQAPGTMWYHPHKHGSVALEVLNGMSGAFIVRDTTTGLDSLVKANGIREVLAAVQQVDSMMNLLDNGPAAPPALVNGLSNAEIPVDSGEVLRVRLVNENVSSSAHFSVFFAGGDTASADTMYDIARDGVQYADANYKLGGRDTSLFIYPGNRLDMFVKVAASPGGTVELHARRLAAPRHVGRVGARRGAQEVRLVRFRVRPRTAARLAPATATVFPASLPALPAFLSNIGPTKDTAVVVFTDTGFGSQSPANPTRFFLGTAQRPFLKYNPELDYFPVSASGKLLPMILGDSQTWIIQHVGSFDNNHPFHIHTNPFQIVQVFAPDTADPFRKYYEFLNKADSSGNPVWSDVVPLPRSVIDTVGGKVDTVAGYVVIRQRYADFGTCKDCGNPYGQLVMHCHILGHEERGMMQLLEIFKDTASAAAYLAAHPRVLTNEGVRFVLPRPGIPHRGQVRPRPRAAAPPVRRPATPGHQH